MSEQKLSLNSVDQDVKQNTSDVLQHMTDCEDLSKTTSVNDHHATAMSFISEPTALEEASINYGLNQLPPDYMYSVLFKEIILEIDEKDTKPLEDLIKYCREQGIAESELDYFQREYYHKSAIRWYSEKIFLCNMLDKALQSLDMNTMIKLSFFIRNLHFELKELYEKQLTNFQDQFIVYRGQLINEEDLQHLIHIRGGLFSFNNFLSTSKEKEVAMNIVRNEMEQNKAAIGIIFIMTIDPNKISPPTTTSFALIDDYSAVPSQQEILFTMHTIFRVIDIKQTNENSQLWEVELTISNDNDPELTSLMNCIKEDISETGWYGMAKLMLRMGQFNQAEELYNKLLKNATGDDDKAYIYQQLGKLKENLGEYQEAVQFYEKSIQIYIKSLPEDHPSLAPIYKNIGQVYSNIDNNAKALEFYEKSLQISEKSVPPNHPDLAKSYANIASIFYQMGDYSKALEFYEKSHQIKEKALPPNCPDLAISYNDIGQVYDNMSDYSKALEFYEKSLKIRKDALPPNHPDLATTYDKMGMAYCNIGNFSKGLQLLEQALAILQESLPPSHPYIKLTMDNIDSVKNKQ